ncbi:MG2 domain-containing protein [Xylophilus sp. GOD-11R]|nr:MG2 domain-containing protein [Xylophilus sp. GOD-11R]WPB55064.1 MG2 domain-containing protein [Xylophilus sp. GOD-11R]
MQIPRFFHRASGIVLFPVFLLLSAGAAQALQITAFTPQGEVAQVRQAVASFDAPAVRFGDPQAAAPLQIVCDGGSAPAGQGRWLSDRRWAWDFAAELPAGTSCRATVQAAFRSPTGEAITPGAGFRFGTGGPFVQMVQPDTEERIDEQQIFLLRLSGPATTASLLANTWCQVEGLGERVPVRAVDGPQRDAVLRSQGLTRSAAASPLVFPTIACNRTMPAAGRVTLVYGRGVASPGGTANRVEKRWQFRVQEPFQAELSCERENAQAACMPIRPLSLRFNAPVTRKMAASIRLVSPQRSLEPVFDEKSAPDDAVVDSIRFTAPLPERTSFTLTLPANFQDAAGRPLRNPAAFPMTVATAAYPPLAKFAAAPFGIVERFAEPGSEKTGKAMLPVTLRNVEAGLGLQGVSPGRPAGTVTDLRPQSDAEILAWLAKVERYNDATVPREQAAREVRGPLPPTLPEREGIESRAVSLLAGLEGARTLALPASEAGDPRPFEVVGIPLDPGFHVVEIASPRLGQSLLDPAYGAQRPMYVRTATLVTNLGVHFKLGREGAIAWVTTLDRGRPVEGARVRVSDCAGKEMAQAVSDASGIARFDGLSSEPARCGALGVKAWEWRQAYFVSARAADDLGFVWSDSMRGIEPWRFGAPTSRAAMPDLRTHTVFDRTLLRAGETVSMKHLLRRETVTGFAAPTVVPPTLVITHDGSGQEFTQPLAWRKTATGGSSAESSLALPPTARLGSYSVALRYDRTAPRDAEYAENDPTRGLVLPAGSFRVEAFRLPVYQGRIAPVEQKPLVRPETVPVQLQIGYVAGGAAANLPVQVSGLVRGKSLQFADQEGFSFEPPRARRDDSGSDAGEETAQAADDARVVADKLPVVLDRNGAGKVTIDGLPRDGQARELLMEARYADPNGEVQTLRSTTTLWPAAVIAGIQAEGWVSVDRKARFQALALGLDGKPQAGVALSVKAAARTVTTSRKRLVGGFYTYDNHTETRDLGEVCAGKSDSRGLLDCEASLAQAGEVELVATARDRDHHQAQAATSVYVTGQGEVWFGGEEHDRIDVLPEKKSYQPGETARFQVRMPFREATALVAVEREGIVEHRVVQLRGRDPTLDLKVGEGWAPNVYVSVLALRGRLREVPWYSFFTWGLRSPREWWSAFRFEGRDWVAPTALVDLSKPAYRLGMAEIRVGGTAHRIDVKVAADKENYPVRARAQVTISATLPGGKPAAGAEVALAAVDEALLELLPNDSWNLLDAMLQRRAWGVQTATAQMDIVGRRHYGRKAVPAGGGGGHAATRELLDTLLLWNPRVVLDAQGRAVVEVPLNDALTRFRIVAVADAGVGLFGTGQTTVRATQDLQIVSGLPPLLREGDRFRAQVTLRNTTGRAMKVEVAARAAPLELATQTIEIAPNEAREVAWETVAPAIADDARERALEWEITARDTTAGSSASTARDALKLRQRIVPAVPLQVGQATLVQLDGSYRLDVAPPAEALPATGAKRGGLRLALRPRLADGLPGVRDWFLGYPFACLEQQASKAIGLADAVMWGKVTAGLPGYLDADGLASYFPPREEHGSRGSDTLTAYLLAAAHQAASTRPQFTLPAEARERMLQALTAFVEGRIQRDFWSPRKDLDERKLAALEALSRYGRAQGRMVGSITVAPNQWPTHAVIDWLQLLQRVADVPQRQQRLDEARQVLRARLSYQGTRLVFSTEREDRWSWLMVDGDVNAARLLLAVVDDPAWKDDLPRLVAGLVERQRGGAWSTTTANLWGSLALQRFSARFESQPVAGSTRASLGAANATLDWSRPPADQPLTLPWPATGAGTLEVTQQGAGKPWLTVQALAAVPRTQALSAGYTLRKTITPVEQATQGVWTRGDVLRVTLEVDASADMRWVVLSDPVPGGATILGSGLGRDSEIATRGESKSAGGYADTSPAYEERGFEAYRAYYEHLPRGKSKVQYTVRLNNAGSFGMPASRVEAMYAPEVFGEAPNARLQVEVAK